MNTPLSLRTRLLGLALLVLLIGLGLTAWNGVQARRTALREARAQLTEVTQVSALAQQRLIESARLLLVGLSRLPELARGDYRSCGRYFADLRSAIPNVTNLGIADLNGNVLCSARPTSGPMNIADREYFRRALRRGRFAAGGYVVGRVTGMESLTFALPVRDASESAVGVAFAAFNLDAFLPPAGGKPLPEGGQYLALDRHGTVLAAVPGPEYVTGRPVPVAALRAVLGTGGPGTLEAGGAGGVERLYAYAPVRVEGETCLFVAIGVPKEAFFGPGERRLLVSLGGLGAILALVLAAIWLGHERWILRPVGALLEATEAMEKGARGTRVRGLGPAAEFVRIESAFNRMAGSLEERERQLAGLLEVSADWYWEQDADLRMKGFSENMRDYAAIAQRDFLGRPRWDTPHFGVSAEQWAAHRTALEAREPFRDFVVGRITSSGERRFVSISGVPVFDREGRFTGYRGVSKDVTDRVRAEIALRQSESRYRSLVELSPDAVFTQFDGRILYINEPGARLYGARSAAEIEGRHILDLIDPSERERVVARLGEIEAGAAPLALTEIVQRRLDGSTFVGEVHSKPMDIDGRRGALTVVRDVSQRRRMQQALRESEAQYRMLFEKNPIPMWVYRREDLRFLAVNDAAIANYGYRREEFLGMTIHDIRAPDAPPLRIADGGDADEVRDLGHSRHRRRDGTVLDVHVITLGLRFQGMAAHLAHVTDITERLHREEQIEFLANHDGLTGLPNRNLLTDRVIQSLESARRSNRSAALLVFDLDNFKLMNDSFGHQGGDALLKEVAARISGAVRGGDTVARLGGDEFVVLLSNLARADDVTQVIEKLRAALAAPFALEGKEVFVTASIGATLFPDDGADMATLLRNADVAMYQAKEQGRDEVKFFTAEFSRRAAERIALEAELRRALERREFVLHYQPVVDLYTRRIIGAEALVRWQHPARGLVPPGQFIPVMEETGLIAPLGSWILDECCGQLARWDASGLPLLSLALNVSARQFRGASFTREVGQALTGHGLGAGRLEIELTETMVMGNAAGFVDMLRELKQLGVGVLIDDFGTGYSSLSYLKRFPIDKLKIDQSFVSGIVEDPNDAAIARTVIALGHSLGVAVVAEGVESYRQLEFLRLRDCDQVQGYYFGRPMPAEAFQRLVRDGLPAELWLAQD